jgi:excisionase family DNA binding protein
VAEQEWFTVGEAADYLRLSKPSIYRLVGQGVLPAYTIGFKGERRFKRADLDAVLQPRTPRGGEDAHRRTAAAA